MIKINTDAAYNPNTKEAGIGIQIMLGKERVQLKVYVSEVSDNHIVEFLALIIGLNYLNQHYDKNETIIYQSDSKIVIQSLEKEYVKNQKYKHLLDYILLMKKDWIQFYPSWIPEAENRGADALAKQSLRKEGALTGEYDYAALNLEDI